MSGERVIRDQAVTHRLGVNFLDPVGYGVRQLADLGLRVDVPFSLGESFADEGEVAEVAQLDLTMRIVTGSVDTTARLWDAETPMSASTPSPPGPAQRETHHIDFA